MSESNEEVKDNKVIYVTYELRVGGNGGEIVDEADDQSPFAFLYGAGNVLPDFEENLKGLKEGDSFKFSIESEKAYGPLVDDYVVEVPISVFMVDGKLQEDMLQPGKVVPMRDQDNNPLQGKILEVGDETVKIDFNHPLAGEDLYFTGTVSQIREATGEELQHGHVHGQGGVHH